MDSMEFIPNTLKPLRKRPALFWPDPRFIPTGSKHRMQKLELRDACTLTADPGQQEPQAQ